MYVVENPSCGSDLPSDKKRTMQCHKELRNIVGIKQPKCADPGVSTLHTCSTPNKLPKMMAIAKHKSAITRKDDVPPVLFFRQPDKGGFHIWCPHRMREGVKKVPNLLTNSKVSAVKKYKNMWTSHMKAPKGGARCSAAGRADSSPVAVSLWNRYFNKMWLKWSPP